MKLDIDLEDVEWNIENCFLLVKENCTRIDMMTELIYWKSIRDLIKDMNDEYKI